MARKPRGEYRTETKETGVRYAWVSDARLGFDIPEADYREKGYEPDFDQLPTKEGYDAARS